MFTNHDAEVVGFDSKSNTVKSTSEIGSQTASLSYDEKSTGPAPTQSIQCQTSSELTNNSVPDVDYDRLAAWLKRIYPLVEEQLTNDQDQVAFENYKPDIDSADNISKLLNTLQKPDWESKNQQKFRVSCLDWNCTGNTIAVAFSEEHESLCIHDVFIHTYSIDRNGNYLDPPTNKLLVPACISTVKYHPTEPSVLVAGCVSGQIVLWIPTPEKRDMVSNTFTGHTENVTQITWHKIESLNDYIVISSGVDAAVIIWDVDIQLHKLTIKERYKIHLPQLMNRMVLRSERGVTCFSFSLIKPDKFVVGVEGGNVLGCSLNAAKPLPEVIDGLTSLNPVVTQYEGHEGDVRTVSYSPYRKNIFFSCGLEGDVHIYDEEQETALQIIFAKENLYKCYWIPSEEKALIACGEKGIKLFSLHNGQQIIHLAEDCKDSLTHIAFNSKSPNLTAVGNLRGEVMLWNIPYRKLVETVKM